MTIPFSGGMMQKLQQQILAKQNAGTAKMPPQVSGAVPGVMFQPGPMPQVPYMPPAQVNPQWIPYTQGAQPPAGLGFGQPQIAIDPSRGMGGPAMAPPQFNVMALLQRLRQFRGMR